MSLADRLERELPAELERLFGLRVTTERIQSRLVVRAPEGTVMLDRDGTVEGEDLFAEQVALAVTLLAAGEGGPWAHAKVDPTRGRAFLEKLDRRFQDEIRAMRLLEGSVTKRHGDFLLVYGERGHGVVHASGYGTGEGPLWDRLKAVVAMTAAETL